MVSSASAASQALKFDWTCCFGEEVPDDEEDGEDGEEGAWGRAVMLAVPSRRIETLRRTTGPVLSKEIPGLMESIISGGGGSLGPGLPSSRSRYKGEGPEEPVSWERLTSAWIKGIAKRLNWLD